MSDIQSFKRGFEMALSRKLKLQQSSVYIVPVVPASAAPTPPAAVKQLTDEQYRISLLGKVRNYYRQRQPTENS